jgi:hypothetical protein
MPGSKAVLKRIKMPPKFKDYKMIESDRISFFLTDPKVGLTAEIARDRNTQTMAVHRAKRLKEMFADKLRQGCTLTVRRTITESTATHCDIKNIDDLIKD